MKLLIAIAVAALISTPAVAQEAVMEEVVVTGSRMIEWDPDDIPAVQLFRRADNLIASVRVVNDTREAAGRRGELIQTLRAMARQAAGRADIDLSIEADGVLVPLTEDMVSTLTLGVDGSRSDTSVASLVVKTPISATDTLDSASGRLEAFVEGVPTTGRSEVDINDEWQLSIVDPPQYRMAILGLISADAQRAATTFGGGYGVEVTGMENRVTWRQSGPLDLGLFIPYKMTVVPRP
ncbi:MAG: TonB-dependent receptor [Brevundimonas sp.]|nr:MAG: TonB-dependent receptor [Brevundimonas sp.]